MISPAARLVRAARRKAGLTQRQLARRSGVAQPAIAAIEAGRQDPRLGTLRTLLRGAGYDLDLVEVLSTGVDRTLIQQELLRSPAERARLATQEAAVLAKLDEAGARLRARYRR